MARVTKTKILDACEKEWGAVVSKFGSVRVDSGTHQIKNIGDLEQNALNYAKCNAFYNLGVHENHLYKLDGRFNAEETIKKLTEYVGFHFKNFSEKVGESAKKLNLDVCSDDETLKKAIGLNLLKKETQYFGDKVKNHEAFSQLVQGISKLAVLREIVKIKNSKNQ